MYLNLVYGTIIASICFIFSYLIWHKKKLWLITGSTEHINDKNKLAKYTGIFLIAAGIYWFVFMALIFTIPKSILTICIIAFCIITPIFQITIFKKIK